MDDLQRRHGMTTISIDLDDYSHSLVEHEGAAYSINVKRVYKCHKCGRYGAEAEHKAKIYAGMKFHIDCLRSMYSKSFYETKHKKEIAFGVMQRASIGKVLSPDDIYQIAEKVATKVGSFARHLLPFDDSTGMYAGKMLSECIKIDKQEDVEGFKERRRLLQKFWIDCRNININDGEKELAILLSILGDKHAIRHATRRNPRNIRRSKAVNT